MTFFENYLHYRHSAEEMQRELRTPVSNRRTACYKYRLYASNVMTCIYIYMCVCVFIHIQNSVNIH